MTGVEPRRAMPDLGASPLRVHLVGIGGASMNAIATVLIAMGHRVSGSDQRRSPVTDRLAGLGARIALGHAAENLDAPDLVAYSSAVSPLNVEVAEAARRGARTLTRAEMLAAICRSRRTIAVSGTHGKTTTTAMLVAVLLEAGLGPSFMVGGELMGGTGGAHWGPGPWLVVEADESDGTFLHLGAEAAVVTSVQADHLDYYGDLGQIEAAFARFVSEVPGMVVLCADDPVAARLGTLANQAVRYGTAEGADFRATVLSASRMGCSFEVVAWGEDLGRFDIPLPGAHNVLNATAALAMAASIGVEPGVARGALSRFGGVRRRFELRGSAGGVTFVDDYAHNPGKLAAVLQGARDGGWGRVVAVFQPHRYSRTEALWRELADALTAADVVVVTEVYPAGEAPLPGVSGRLVADAVRSACPTKQVIYAQTREELVQVVAGTLAAGDLCLTLGAGDITTLATELLERASRGQEGR